MRLEGPESVVKWTMPPQRRCWITWVVVVVLLLAPSCTNSQESQPKPVTTVCKYSYIYIIVRDTVTLVLYR